MVHAGRIPLAVTEVGESERRAVMDCIDSGWVSSAGPDVASFESEAAALVGRSHGVATSSGTAALHVALLSSNVGPGDCVVVPSLTFIAPANAVAYVGATPVFIDADISTWQMDVRLLEEFLVEGCEGDPGALRERQTGCRVAALLPVHILGHPTDMDPLMAIARKFQIPVIEDTTESYGAKYKGRPLGGDGAAACLSFNGNKLLTAGGGGLIATDDPLSAARARYLTTQAKDDPDEYIHDEVGYNYRMSNLTASLGRAQIQRFETHLSAKRRIFAHYQAMLSDVPGIELMPEAEWARSSCWLSTVLIEEELFGKTSRQVMRALRERGIETRPLWQPLHNSKAHAGAISLERGIADSLYRKALSLPSSVGLTAIDQERVIEEVHSLR